jgi:vacuolar-type H+-ATPase subunit B/Vma2
MFANLVGKSPEFEIIGEMIQAQKVGIAGGELDAVQNVEGPVSRARITVLETEMATPHVFAGDKGLSAETRYGATESILNE